MPITATWTSPAAAGTLDLSTGSVLTEGWTDAVASNFLYLGSTVGMVGARAARGSNQSIANNTSTNLTFTTEDQDTAAMFTPGGSVVTITFGGTYIIVGYVVFEANATGRRIAQLSLNGGTTPAARLPAITTADPTVLTMVTVRQMAATETAAILVYQDSGGALNVSEAFLTVHKL